MSEMIKSNHDVLSPLFSHAGRATKHYEEKKAPGDYKIVPGNLSKVPKLPTFVV